MAVDYVQDKQTKKEQKYNRAYESGNSVPIPGLRSAKDMIMGIKSNS